MSKFKNLIIKSLEYYDNNQQTNSKILSKIKYFRPFSNDKDMESSKVICYNKHKKPLFEASYEYLGIYNSMSNIWTWGWAIPSLYKNATYISRKILNYGFDINVQDDKLLKMELITSRFKIESHTQLDIHIAISSYISKIPFILNIYDPYPNETYTNDQYGKFYTLDDFTTLYETRFYERSVFFLFDIKEFKSDDNDDNDDNKSDNK